MNIWIILYKDGTLMTWKAGKPKSSNYEKGAKLYKVDNDATIWMLSDWMAYNYPETNWIIEVKEW